MKQIFILLALGFAFLKVSAQTSPCTPDTTVFPKNTVFGLYPDSLNAKGDTAYEQTLQFKFPKQMVVAGNTVIIDTVIIDAVSNLPQSFGYQCSSKNCDYKGVNYGCARMAGSPTNSQAGIDSLVIHFTVYFHSPFLPTTPFHIDTTSKIKLTISKNPTSGIFSSSVNPNFEVAQNYPNPFNQNTEISFNSTDMQATYLVVRNELGQQVSVQKLQAVQGANTFNFSRNNLPQGLYFYSIENGGNIITRSMVIKD